MSTPISLVAPASPEKGSPDRGSPGGIARALLEVAPHMTSALLEQISEATLGPCEDPCWGWSSSSIVLGFEWLAKNAGGKTRRTAESSFRKRDHQRAAQRAGFELCVLHSELGQVRAVWGRARRFLSTMFSPWTVWLSEESLSDVPPTGLREVHLRALLDKAIRFGGVPRTLL